MRFAGRLKLTRTSSPDVAPDLSGSPVGVAVPSSLPTTPLSHRKDLSRSSSRTKLRPSRSCNLTPELPRPELPDAASFAWSDDTKWSRVYRIANGACGTVYKARHESGAVAVVKVFARPADGNERVWEVLRKVGPLCSRECQFSLRDTRS